MKRKKNQRKNQRKSRRGEIKILDAFSQTVIDFKAVKDKYPDCNLIWMPYTTLKDIQQNYVDDCVDNDIEPAVPGILPAEGEGTKLVNDLFDRHSSYTQYYRNPLDCYTGV